MQLDPRAPSLPLQKYMLNETRFNILNHANAASAKHLLGEAVDDVRSRWELYQKLASLPAGDMHNLGTAVLETKGAM